MSREHADRMLVGPVVTDPSEEQYSFAVLRGCDCGAGPHLHVVETDSAPLLESMRLAWLVVLKGQEPLDWVIEMFDSEPEMHGAAAVLWPEQFGSTATERAVRAAGGSRA